MIDGVSARPTFAIQTAERIRQAYAALREWQQPSTLPGWPEIVERLDRIMPPYATHVPVIEQPGLDPFGWRVVADPLQIHVGDALIFRTRLAIAIDRREIMDRLRLDLGHPVCDCGRRGSCSGHHPTCPAAPSAIEARNDHVRRAVAR